MGLQYKHTNSILTRNTNNLQNWHKSDKETHVKAVYFTLIPCLIGISVNLSGRLFPLVLSSVGHLHVKANSWYKNYNYQSIFTWKLIILKPKTFVISNILIWVILYFSLILWESPNNVFRVNMCVSVCVLILFQVNTLLFSINVTFWFKHYFFEKYEEVLFSL